MRTSTKTTCRCCASNWRASLSGPQLVLSDRIPDFAVTGKYEPQWLEQVEPGDFTLSGYQHHAPLTAPMAV